MSEQRFGADYDNTIIYSIMPTTENYSRPRVYIFSFK